MKTRLNTTFCAWIISGVALLLVGCQTTPATSKPPAWSVVDTIVNSATPSTRPGEARQTVFFSQIPWQSANRTQPYFASGWMNDVLVGNPYSFQIRMDGGNFLNGGLILRDPGTGQEFSAIQPRVNYGENCGPNGHRQFGGTTPQTADSSKQCFYDPGEIPHDPSAVGFITRPVLPQNTTSYSVELVSSCDGRLQYTDMTCPPPRKTDAVTVLTISPPVRPSSPTHGQKFSYNLVARNNVGDSETALSAVYVEPKRCKIDNFFINPAQGNAGDRATAEWFVRDCYSVQLTTSDPAAPVLYSAKTSLPNAASEAQFNDTRPYVLPKRLEVTMTLEARDALGTLTKKTARVDVSPCSISTTHPQCPSRCQTTPLPADCPRPPTPVCNPGEGDANRQHTQFNFEVLCSVGTPFKKYESEWSCTEEQARQSVNNRQTLGCAVVKATGPWVTPGGGTTTQPACIGGATPKGWKFCLACSSQSGPIRTPETRTACFLNDAVDAAKLNYPTQTCWLNNQGDCP